MKKLVEKLRSLRKPVVIDKKDCAFQSARGSGPGGQAVAKTNNMAIIKHLPSNIVVKVAIMLHYYYQLVES